MLAFVLSGAHALAVTVEFGGQVSFFTNVTYQAQIGAQEMVEWGGSDNWGNRSTLNGNLDDRPAGSSLSVPTNGMVLTTRAIYSSHPSRTNTVAGVGQLGINQAGADNTNCLFSAADACRWTFSFPCEVWVEKLTFTSFGPQGDLARLVIAGVTNSIAFTNTVAANYDPGLAVYAPTVPLEVPAGTNLHLMAAGGEWGLGSVVVSLRKKGFCGRGGVAALNAVKPHWYYNWGVWPASGAQPQFVPMMFAAVNITSNTVNAVTQQKRSGTTRHLLGFNEPDHSGQANMTVAEALAAWPQMEAIGLKLVSPAVSYQLTWMDDFMSQAASLGYRVDSVGYHKYLNLAGSSSNGSSAAGSLITSAKSFFNRYGKPVWLTETGDDRAFDDPTALNQSETFWYLWHLLPRLDTSSFVERYAVYSGPNYGHALFYDGQITGCGVLYKAFDQVPLILMNPTYAALAAYKSNAEKLALGMELLLVPPLAQTNIVATVADEWLWSASPTEQACAGGLAVAYFGGLAMQALGYERTKVVEALARTAAQPGEYQPPARTRLAQIAPEIVAPIPTIIDFGGLTANVTNPAYQAEIGGREIVTWNGDDIWGHDETLNGTLKDKPAGATLTAPSNQVTLTSRLITSSNPARTNTVTLAASLGINGAGASSNLTFDSGDATTWTFAFDADVVLKTLGLKGFGSSQERAEVTINGATTSISVAQTSTATYDSTVALYTFPNPPRISAGTGIKIAPHNGEWRLACVVVRTTTTPYAEWLDSHALGRGVKGTLDADPDGDGACNLVEYALGGNPTNASHVGWMPSFALRSVGDTNWFEYVYCRRRDAAARGLSYSVEVNGTLTQGLWTNSGISELGTSVVNTEFERVTNCLAIANADRRFVRLKIGQTP